MKPQRKILALALAAALSPLSFAQESAELPLIVITAVSYTHLDVYKRQALAYSCPPAPSNGFLDER